jgi:uncharacterized protein
MKHSIVLCFIVGSWMLLSEAGSAQQYDPRISDAQQFLDQMVTGQFEQAVATFDSVLTARMPPEILKQVWEALQQQVGSFESAGTPRTEINPPYVVVNLACRFSKTSLDMKLTFNDQHKIAGLFFLPAKDRPWKIPSYADTALFLRKPAEVVTGDIHLKGELTIPKNRDNYPVVVLVHGSGPEDMDETIWSNKIFKDLAWGLSSKGISVLRYNKRTLTYGAEMNKDSITVERETIDDALSAISLASTLENADGVYLLGHSLGGYLAPWIASETNALKGEVIMAGNSRPIEDLVLEQVKYILGLDGLSHEDSMEIKEMTEKVDMVKSDLYTDSTDLSMLPLGIPPAYWESVRFYDPVKTAEALTIPILILQGERDYQVTMKDFEGWKQGLKDKENVRCIVFPDLNHLFLTGEGKSTPDEYYKEGHVSEKVIDVIATWIKGTE